MSKKLILAIVLGVSLTANAQLGPVPVQPTTVVQETCTATDVACNTRNQMAMAAYQSAMANYQNQMQAYTAGQQAAAAAAARAAAAQEAALAAAKRAEKENKGGSSAYGTSQMICTAVSIALAAVCSTPTGQWACAPSAMFGMLAGMAGGQKATHDKSQSDACIAASQISTAPANCGAAPAPYNPSAWPANSTTPLTDTFNSNGNCIGTQAQCQAIVDNLPPGTNIHSLTDGISQFASGKGPFSVNPDGSIKMKNGKTYGLGAFTDKKSMMDAGFSAAQADSMMAMLNKAKSAGELDAKAALAKESDTSGGDVAGGAGAAGKFGEGAANGDANGGAGKDASKTRGLASEGLTKDFNGEMIGAAGDDIFKMMNRRYRLKAKQDSFLMVTP